MEQLLFESEDSSTINSSFIERLNLTLRQGCAYLGRRTAGQKTTQLSGNLHDIGDNFLVDFYVFDN